MSPAPRARVDVRPELPATTFSRNLFGSFVEHFHRQVYGGILDPGSPLSDERGFRRDVLEAVREMGVPVVRWPGGCFVSDYHWRDGVGPERTPSYDRAWRVEEPNTFGTDEFLAWCRAVGAEPYVCTNAGTGTPEEMADWLEYCNGSAGGRWARLRAENGHPQPHGVRYWSIGNENYGDWEVGAKSPQEWGRYVAESAKLMRRVDPGVTLFAAAVEDPDWNLPLLQQAGRHLDGISIHGYWDALADVDAPSGYLECMARTLEPEASIQRAEATIRAAGFAGRLTIAFDEWNLRGWHHPWGSHPGAIEARDRNDDDTTYTMADAVFSAAFLITCLRHADSVTMANLAPAVNARGPLHVHPGGVVKRPTFHVLSMCAGLLAGSVLDATVVSDALDAAGTSVPVVDAVATGEPGSARTVLALVNKSEREEVACELVVGGAPVTGSHPAVVLTAPSPDSCNDVAHPDVVVPRRTRLRAEAGAVRLPPHSLVVLELEGASPVPSPGAGRWSTTGAGGWRLR